MEKPELFNWSIGVILKAYINGTLVAQNTCGCVLGNLIANRNKIKYSNNISGWPSWDTGTPDWNRLINTSDGIQRLCSKKRYNSPIYENEKKGAEQLKSIGYEFNDLALIEYTFETEGRISLEDGLYAVIKVIQKIHKCSKEEIILEPYETPKDEEAFFQDLWDREDKFQKALNAELV
jgi:hypothetical protein